MAKTSQGANYIEASLIAVGGLVTFPGANENNFH
jgi:hypothetical protein